MLDEEHRSLPIDTGDDNNYVLGHIDQHNIVMACLPGQYGTNNAAIVATNLKRSFPSILATLMAGIGGASPSKADLYLGDVVVGTRVMQYDMGKVIVDGQFQETADANTPAPLLNSAVSNLRSRHGPHPYSSRSALQVIAQPRQQSGQCTVQEIYRQAARLEQRGNMVKMLWVPSGEEDFAMGGEGKAEARRAAHANRPPEKPAYQARSTHITLATARQRRQYQGTHLDGVGRYSKTIDKALPGQHTRSLYDAVKRRESDVLAQLRTGMARIKRGSTATCTGLERQTRTCATADKHQRR